MIKELFLQNFQSHKKSALELDPGVNVIVGDTDSGKSAIIRALYWLTFGKPSGVSMLRRGQKQCQVGVKFDTGESVFRVRSASDNYYDVNGELYKGFGQSVPAPVSQILNLSEINFMRQMDPPFLFSKSAGEVADYFNQLINLDVIGTSLANINRMVRSTEKEKDICERRVLELRTDLTSLSWIDAADEAVSEIEKQESIVLKLKRSVQQLTDELRNYIKYKREIEQCADEARTQKRLDQIDSTIKKINDKRTHLAALRKARSDYKEATTCINALFNTSKAEKAIVAIETQASTLATLQNRCALLEQQLSSYQHYSGIITKCSGEIKTATLQYTQEMPEYCPLCGQLAESNNM